MYSHPTRSGPLKRLISGILGFLSIISSVTASPRGELFNKGWKFSLEAGADPQELNFDDQSWRTVTLPHDWSVESSFDKGLEGCTGYLPGGIGWYRKHFPSPSGATDKITYLYFDGVYNNSEVWLNGQKLGQHPYGYSPFYYDISKQLRTDGKENLVAVKVDHSRYADSRWYTGSGIYRDVTLITVNKLHIPVWGTFVTTPEIAEKSAVAALDIQVKNDSAGVRDFKLTTEILDPSGVKVATESSSLSLEPNAELTKSQRVTIPSPQLWDTENPWTYTAVTTIVDGDKTVDRYETKFGIRTIRFDADKGFFLNGKHTYIKGVCLHHDGGLVGAAVPKGVWKRRLQTLRDGGCNAIRTAHNPPSAEFLDLCDEMGFLVQDEFFDDWDYAKDKRQNMADEHSDYITRGYTEHFQQRAESDLRATMLRDRNHPSIIQWSIGNEIEWTYPQNRPATGYFDMDWKGNYFWTPPRYSPAEIKERYDAQEKTEHMIGDTAKKLAAWTRQYDTTRPVTANMILPSVSYISGYAEALDMVGFSYRRVVYDYGHENFPDMPVMGTENLGQWHEWKAVLERPFIAGIFIWTGIDYMGEARDGWPKKGTPSGLLDFAGFKKPSWHMMKSLWSDEPELYLSTQVIGKSPYRLDKKSGAVVEKKADGWEHALWTWREVNEYWNYADNEMVVAEVISNCPQVELFLNGKSLGSKQLTDFPDRIYKWAVPFAAGKIEARGKYKDRPVISELVTATAPTTIQLKTDRKSISADGVDVVHVVAQLVDAKGNPVRNENREITFELKGGGVVLGVDNGAVDNVQDYQSNKITTSQGRCLLLIQSDGSDEALTVTATSDGMTCEPVRISTLPSGGAMSN